MTTNMSDLPQTRNKVNDANAADVSVAQAKSCSLWQKHVWFSCRLHKLFKLQFFQVVFPTVRTNRQKSANHLQEIIATCALSSTARLLPIAEVGQFGAGSVNQAPQLALWVESVPEGVLQQHNCPTKMNKGQATVGRHRTAIVMGALATSVVLALLVQLIPQTSSDNMAEHLQILGMLVKHGEQLRAYDRKVSPRYPDSFTSLFLPQPDCHEMTLAVLLHMQ